MIQAAIVGCGNIAHSHVEGLLAFPDRCRIAALCDIYPEKAEKMKQKYGLGCPVFDDHEKMLASGLKIDLVHVCTPPYVHAQIAIHAMDAGMNTVVEKPMATCLEECDAMLEAEKRNGVTMACIARNRFRNSIYKGCTRSIVSLPITKEDDYYTFQGILKHAVHFHEKKASVENFAEEGFSLGNYEEKK